MSDNLKSIRVLSKQKRFLICRAIIFSCTAMVSATSLVEQKERNSISLSSSNSSQRLKRIQSLTHRKFVMIILLTGEVVFHKQTTFSLSARNFDRGIVGLWGCEKSEAKLNQMHPSAPEYDAIASSQNSLHAFSFVSTCIHSCPFVFTCVHLCPLVFIRVHLCPLVFTCVHLCSFVFTCVHLCSLVFTWFNYPQDPTNSRPHELPT